MFTHLIEGQAEFYLDEVARVLAPEGISSRRASSSTRAVPVHAGTSERALHQRSRSHQRGRLRPRLVRRTRSARAGAGAPRAECAEGARLPVAAVAHARSRGRAGRRAAADDAGSAAGRRRSCAAGADRIGLDGAASDGAMPAPTRQPLPPLDPVYVELQGAKSTSRRSRPTTRPCAPPPRRRRSSSRQAPGAGSSGCGPASAAEPARSIASSCGRSTRPPPGRVPEEDQRRDARSGGRRMSWPETSRATLIAT